jgi:hypothetical protein
MFLLHKKVINKGNLAILGVLERNLHKKEIQNHLII